MGDRNHADGLLRFHGVRRVGIRTPGGRGAGHDHGFSLYDFADRLCTRGWQVPAYPLPVDCDDVVRQRILVRQGDSRDLATMQLDNMREALAYVEERPVQIARTGREASGFHHWRDMTNSGSMTGKTGRLPVIHSRGAWSFGTQLRLRHPDGREEVRHSRTHRKRLAALPYWENGLLLILRAIWIPGDLNWWIGVVFATGASLFALGCVLFLAPSMAAALQVSEAQANGVFFLGSIPFTIAAYLQLFQAANAGPIDDASATGSSGTAWFGWRPGDAGWLSCALQFVGTLLFNLNTFDAMHPGVQWWEQDLLIWVPNVVGSILFLASGYLAWIEVCHAHWAWDPRYISWCVAAVNLMGCIAFMISALFAFVPAHDVSVDAATLSLAFTLIGAIAFFIGAILMLPETAAAQPGSNQLTVSGSKADQL